MLPVVLTRCDSYQPAELAPALEKLLAPLGGMAAFVKPGMKVLIKPNLLGAAEPEKRVTTDPALLRLVTQMVLDLSAKPIIADSPAIEPFKRVAAKSGAAAVGRELGVPVIPLANPREVAPPAPARFKTLQLAEDALSADAVINLPKLKTHCQMFLTLAVKNLFGTVVAQRKAEWHHMAGLDRNLFAHLLLDIVASVAPALSILDGVWGMERLGPSHGDPVKLSILAASPDPVALDLAVCRLLGQPLSRFPLARAAGERGLAGADPDQVRLLGDPPESLAPAAFQVPELDSMHLVPGMFEWFTRRYLVSKPVASKADCKLCGRCVSICPQQAMRLGGKRVEIDYDRCIRCYCCDEVCPEDAIDIQRGLLVRALNLLGR